MIPEEQLQEWDELAKSPFLGGAPHITALIAEVRRLREVLEEAQGDFCTLDIIRCEVCEQPDIETCGRCATISVGLQRVTSALGTLDEPHLSEDANEG